MGSRTSVGWQVSACGVAWVRLAHGATGWQLMEAKLLPELAQPDDQSPWPLGQWQAAWSSLPAGEQAWPDGCAVEAGLSVKWPWPWRPEGCALGMALPAADVISDDFESPPARRPSEQKTWAWQQAQGMVPWPVHDLVVDWHGTGPAPCTVAVAQRSVVWDRQTLADTLGGHLRHVGCETQAARVGLWALVPTARLGVQGLLCVLPGRLHLQVWSDGQGVFARSASVRGMTTLADWEGAIGRLMQMHLTSPHGGAPLTGVHWVGATQRDDPCPQDEAVQLAVSARWHVPVTPVTWPDVPATDAPRLVVALGLALLAADSDADGATDTHNLMPHRAHAQRRMHSRHGAAAAGATLACALTATWAMSWGVPVQPSTPWSGGLAGGETPPAEAQSLAVQTATREANARIQRAKHALAELQAVEAPQAHRDQLAKDLQTLALRRVTQVVLEEVKREGDVLWVSGVAASSDRLQAWMGQWSGQGEEGWGQPSLQVWARREVDAKQPLGWKFSVRLISPRGAS